MTPVEWDGDIKVAENGDAFGFNRAALTAMRYAAEHERTAEQKRTECATSYDPMVVVGTAKLFAGIERGIDELREAAYESGQRESAQFAYSDFADKVWKERLLYRKLIDLVHEAERSICRHLQGGNP